MFDTSTVITLTPEQRMSHARLILGVDDGYHHIYKRLMESRRYDEAATFTREMMAAPNLFDQASIIQEYRRKIGE